MPSFILLEKLVVSLQTMTSARIPRRGIFTVRLTLKRQREVIKDLAPVGAATGSQTAFDTQFSKPTSCIVYRLGEVTRPTVARMPSTAIAP